MLLKPKSCVGLFVIDDVSKQLAVARKISTRREALFEKNCSSSSYGPNHTPIFFSQKNAFFSQKVWRELLKIGFPHSEIFSTPRDSGQKSMYFVFRPARSANPNENPAKTRSIPYFSSHRQIPMHAQTPTPNI